MTPLRKERRCGIVKLGLRSGLGPGMVQFEPKPAETWKKMLFRLVPIADTAPTITRKMQPAINAYSIAVAPD